MEETLYGLRVDVPGTHDEALSRATEALRAEGFGVLTHIDVRKVMKEKLDREVAPYTILGACNPTLAHRALGAELEVGLLLPCNVVVYERAPGRCVVSAIAPLAALGIVGSNEELQAVAVEADRRLRAALASLEPR